jgi:1-pyrroline-5-carboxylate dehydrogenase
MGSSKSLQPLRSASKTLNALPAAYAGAQIASRRYAGTLANFKIPTVNNEPNVRCESDEDVQNQLAN